MVVVLIHPFLFMINNGRRLCLCLLLRFLFIRCAESSQQFPLNKFLYVFKIFAVGTESLEVRAIIAAWFHAIVRQSLNEWATAY